MCGRFARKSTQEVLADWFGLELEEMPCFAPSYNAAPQSVQPVVRIAVLLQIAFRRARDFRRFGFCCRHCWISIHYINPAVMAPVIAPIPASWPLLLPEKMEAVIAGILIIMKMFTTTSMMSNGRFLMSVPGLVKSVRLA